MLEVSNEYHGNSFFFHISGVAANQPHCFGALPHYFLKFNFTVRFLFWYHRKPKLRAQCLQYLIRSLRTTGSQCAHETNQASSVLCRSEGLVILFFCPCKHFRSAIWPLKFSATILKRTEMMVPNHFQCYFLDLRIIWNVYPKTLCCSKQFKERR